MNDTTPIRDWYGGHRFLDNSENAQIYFEGLVFPNVTQAFAGAQAPNLDLKIRCAKAKLSEIEGVWQLIGEAPPGFKAPDTMRRLLEIKFGLSQFSSRMSPLQSAMAKKLLLTGTRPLIYGNSACNQFWGDCGCEKHQDSRGQNVLGGLIMGVREKLVRSLTMGMARYQTCGCENANMGFFLYTHEGKLWLKPFCDECQAQQGLLISKLADDSKVDRFERDWFGSEKIKEEPTTVSKSRIIHHTYNESGLPDDIEDIEDWRRRAQAVQNAQTWARWEGHLQALADEKKLAKNVTYYLSGRIS